MEQRFCQSAGIEATPLRAETVLFNPRSNKFCVLNSSAAFIWQKMTEPRTTRELASELCDCFDVTEDSALRDAETAIRQFLAAEFIQSTTGPAV